MAFQHFTRCVAPSDFKPRSRLKMVAVAGAVAATLIAIAVAAQHWWCIAIAVEIGITIFLILYTGNFLYERLVCLGSDESALGMVLRVSEPGFDYWDNDYSIDLLLCGTPLISHEVPGSLKSAQETPPFGRLISITPAIEQPPVSGMIEGSNGEDVHGTHITAWGLHAEFEGAGPYAMLQFSLGMLGIASIAFLVCLAIPGLGWVLSLVLLLILALGGLISNYTNTGSPADVNAELPTIEVNRDGQNAGADILYVRGTWVWDSLHAWNELHPIKACCRQGKWNKEWTIDCRDRCQRLDRQFEIAWAEETLANQNRPEHRWRVHPVLDGCTRTVIL